MTKYVTEIWVQFSSDEAFSENHERLSGILKQARGDCNLYVFMRDRKVCYQSVYLFDEAKINSLIDAFGAENVRAVTKPVQVTSRSDFKDCCGNCLERIADALERIADTLEGEKAEMRDIDLADVEPCPIAAGFYDKFRERVAGIETLSERNGILADMEEYFRECVRAEPQNRDRLLETYQLLKRKCSEEVPW